MTYRKVNHLFILTILFFLIPAFVLFSQEQDDAENGSFGFGSDGGTESKETTARVSGEISAKLIGFFNDFTSSDLYKNNKAEDIFEGKINFSLSGKITDWVVNLKFHIDPSPIAIDEAYARIYIGPVDLEAGVRKLTWGRADSFGPLDVVNPIDYSDLSAIGNPRNVKIARPMLRASLTFGSFSKLEGVFVPWFEGNRYALKDRWAPEQVTGLPDTIASGLIAAFPLLDTVIQTTFSDWNYDPASFYPKTDTLKYAQGGLRFTTTIGESDFGIQYFFGRLSRPAFNVDLADFIPTLFSAPDTNEINIFVNYNYYHHIGVDFAQVISGFNLRAEAGVNITSDLQGNDGAVYNPQIVWSLGFDRDLLWGINLNLQGNGLVRLMYDKIGDNPLSETEAGVDRSSTRITAILSKKILRDELEFKTTALWGIEDKDFFIIPALIWFKNDFTTELSVGVFGGDRAGELGQYRDNSYIKAIVGWSF